MDVIFQQMSETNGSNKNTYFQEASKPLFSDFYVVFLEVAGGSTSDAFF